MKYRVLMGLVLTLSPVWGQVTSQIESGWRTSDLFERIIRSEFVIRGKVLSASPVGVRDVPPPVRLPDGSYRSPDLADITGGMLFAVEFSAPVCQQRDFSLPGAASAPDRGPVYIFSPVGRTQSDLRQGIIIPKEKLFQDREYLLFLLPFKKQKNLAEKYDLPSDRVYYRVFEGYLGAQELNVDYSPRERRQGDRLLTAVESLCGAAQGKDNELKLSRLRALLEKAEPDWLDSVKEAIAAIEAAQR